ncbi:MAG TPA: acetyl-CoA carboxylase biotin carboxylase subunit [Phycisphaerae bacterium]|nr:acetyl-CoA carboxylase biotin carboxylase subunit [Phycisphaerae bacterium]HRR85764.1 acetyl-CoA carboxylase biotin carboxylase subunit [Phycisphaerae bacterium]
MFSRIMIANRGEIALRIIRACKELGIQTVCVFSEEDRNLSYLKLADRAICIGPGAAAESYLKIDRIIAAAEVANVDAIHPGYGFLAENPQFADACRDSKIEFIGPSSESMRLLGNKIEAKRLAKKAKVPNIPWTEGPVDSDDDAAKWASQVGYPVMIKAAAGGGGRGIRLVHNEATLRHSLPAARSEAQASFKDPSVYLEKAVEDARHVEVQVMGDRAGNVLHFYERDCSLQRRHQKLVEESPCPAINDRIREELCKAAVRLARAAKYYSAGTVEFLVTPDKKFYLLEMNTRIQVEHPVSEMVTGHDLVQLQIRVAAGETLSLKQRDITHKGVAIECRINAEDPAADFRPCPGKIEVFRPPGGFGVRLDTHAHAGMTISPRYDSMIAKLIVHKATRAEAIACMRRCLEEFAIEPVKTTIPIHREIFSHAQFLKGTVDTGFIERTW